MITIEYPTNPEQVLEVLNHPKVYKKVRDDLSLRNYKPNVDSTIFLVIKNNGVLCGVVGITPFISASCQLHIALLPAIYGKRGEVAASIRGWVLMNTRYLKFFCIIPTYNKLAIHFAKRCGFKEEGLLTKLFLRDWKLHDMIILGITREEARCQQQ